MWTKLLCALFCLIGTAWSKNLQPSDLGSSINVFNLAEFNDLHVGLIRNQLVTGEVWLADTVDIIKKSFETSHDDKPRTMRSIDICDNFDKLIEIYFRDIKIALVPNHWRLFTTFWSPESIAIKFGIPKQYATSHYSFILLKTSAVQNEAKITSQLANLQFKKKVRQELVPIDFFNDPDSVREFIDKYGTHFISSYATGGVLYQVFVYEKSSFPNVKNHLFAHFRSNPEISQMNEEVKKYFSPQYAIEVGKIISADGNSTIENWAESVSRYVYDDTKKLVSNSLLNVMNNPTALEEFQSLPQNKVLVKLNMASTIKLIKNKSLRNYFFDTIQRTYTDNLTKLFQNE